MVFLPVMTEKKIILKDNTHRHLSVFKALRKHKSFDDAVTDLLVKKDLEAPQ